MCFYVLVCFLCLRVHLYVWPISKWLITNTDSHCCRRAVYIHCPPPLCTFKAIPVSRLAERAASCTEVLAGAACVQFQPVNFYRISFHLLSPFSFTLHSYCPSNKTTQRPTNNEHRQAERRLSAVLMFYLKNLINCINKKVLIWKSLPPQSVWIFIHFYNSSVIVIITGVGPHRKQHQEAEPGHASHLQ